MLKSQLQEKNKLNSWAKMENWSTVSVTMMTFVNSFLAVVVIFCIGNVKSDSTEELFMNHEIFKK